MLSPHVELAKTTDHVIFSPHPFGQDAGKVETKYLSLAEYEMHEPIMEIWSGPPPPAGSSAKGRKSHITYRMKIARKWPIYFWRIGLFTLIMSMCSLCVFILDEVDGLADRYGVLFNLLLAAVAFQYIINTELPNLSYLTLMDTYVLFSFAFVFLVIVLVSITGFFEVVEWVDSCFFYAAIAVSLVFHVWFVLKSYKARKYEMKKLLFDRWDYVKYGYDELVDTGGAFRLWNKDIKTDDHTKESLLQSSWWTPDEDWVMNNSTSS